MRALFSVSFKSVPMQLSRKDVLSGKGGEHVPGDAVVPFVCMNWL